MGREKKDTGATRMERMVVSVAEIIQELISAHHKGKDVNLNKLKTRIASKYGLETSPRLVDIIAAVPSEYKKVLLPKLKAKPIRTASGGQNETKELIQYIVVHPKPPPAGSKRNAKRHRYRWGYRETQTLLDVMKKLGMGNRHSRRKENFCAVEQEMKKRGIGKWNSSQIQQKWCNLRKDWINMKSRAAKRSATRQPFEFEEELDELLGPDPANWKIRAKNPRQVRVLNYEDVEDEPEVIDLEPMDTYINLEGEMSDTVHTPTAMLEDSEFHESSAVRNTRTHLGSAVAGRKTKKVPSRGTGSYSRALSAFASIISERQEGIIKMMMEESNKAAEEAFRQQQKHEKWLAEEQTALLSSQLAQIMAENTQNILREMASMMGLHLPLTEDISESREQQTSLVL